MEQINSIREIEREIDWPRLMSRGITERRISLGLNRESLGFGGGIRVLDGRRQVMLRPTGERRITYQYKMK